MLRKANQGGIVQIGAIIRTQDQGVQAIAQL